MKLKNRFEIVDMGDVFVAVPVDDNADKLHGVVKLNQTGVEIFDLLKSGVTEDQIVSSIVTRYEDDRSIIQVYVKKFIDTLLEAGIIEE